MHVSVIPDSCTAKVDMLFLLDGSGSMTQSGYDLEREFFKQVIKYVTMESNGKTFLGWGGFLLSVGSSRVPGPTMGAHRTRGARPPNGLDLTPICGSSGGSSIHFNDDFIQ